MAGFVSHIGLKIAPAVLAQPTFLPGLTIDHGVLLVDEARLSYPGDILHEAGHMALAEPAQRAELHHDAGGDPGEEMAAIAWSYAAALYLSIDFGVVFHPQGYKGGSKNIIENFAQRRYVGVPILQWLGMAADAEQVKAGIKPYPHMVKWLRE